MGFVDTINTERPIIYPQVTHLFFFLLWFLCGSAAAGYQVPLTFQMDEWEHEWQQGDERSRGEAFGALEGGDGGRALVTRRSRGEVDLMENPAGDTWLVNCFFGDAAWKVDAAETTHRPRPFFNNIHLRIDPRAQLAKKKTHKKKHHKAHKMDLITHVALWWVKKHQLLTCYELHPLLMVLVVDGAASGPSVSVSVSVSSCFGLASEEEGKATVSMSFPWIVTGGRTPDLKPPFLQHTCHSLACGRARRMWNGPKQEGREDCVIR